MSYFAFKRTQDGEIEVSDQDVMRALEMLVNQLQLLNLRFEDLHNTGIELEDATKQDLI